MYQSILVALLIILTGCAKIPSPMESKFSESGEAPLAQQQTTPPAPTDPFHITLKGLDDLPILSWQKLAIMDAKLRWEDIIIEGLEDVTLPAIIARFLPGLSDQEGPLVIDDLFVQLSWKADENRYIAGTSVWWGQRFEPDLPHFARIHIYPPLTRSHYDAEDWTRILMHEFGHALGFVSSKLEEQDGVEVVRGVRYFNGEQASREYRKILYAIMGEKLAFAIPDIRVPLEPDEASGHWKHPEVQWDIMSPYSNSREVLTGVTLGALVDIGYKVDMTKAKNPNRFLTKLVRGHRFICDGQHTRVAENSERP